MAASAATDLAALTTAAVPATAVPLQGPLLAGGGTLLTGPTKLAQRFAMEVLTATGSMPYLSGRGTGLPNLVQAGVARSEADVAAVFGMAARVAGRNLKAEEGPADPADERYGSATLLRVVLAPGGALVTAAVTSLAGVAASVAIPLPAADAAAPAVTPANTLVGTVS